MKNLEENVMAVLTMIFILLLTLLVMWGLTAENKYVDEEIRNISEAR